MAHKREKGYWLKQTEVHPSSAEAQTRAGALRMHEHVMHVKVRAVEADYEVSYSVAKWYWDQLKEAGIKL